MEDIDIKKTPFASEDCISFYHKPTRYDLLVWTSESRIDPFSVYFEYPCDTSPYLSMRTEGRVMKVTGRDIGHYEKSLGMPRNKIIPDQQYLELGAGLGEFVPFVASLRKNASHPKPIVVDLANYEVMAELLTAAGKRSFSLPIKKKCDDLLLRCETFLDSNKVVLIREDFANVFSSDSLKRCADVVIDNFGACLYLKNAGYSKEQLAGFCQGLLKNNDSRFLKNMFFSI